MERKPALAPYLGRYWKAYQDLQTDRQFGLAVGPIQWSSVDRYARRHGFNSPDEFEDLLFYIRKMDTAEMKSTEAKSKKAPKAKPVSTARKSRR